MAYSQYYLVSLWSKLVRDVAH